MNTTTLKRKAITLLEVLIVLAIIAVLIGFLIPANRQVRDAAARMSCQNNLKQIGIAIHDYFDFHGQLPTASVENSNLKIEDQFSLHYTLLPYIEQDSLFREFNMNESANSDANLKIGQKQIPKPFTCHNSFARSLNSYIAISGIGEESLTEKEITSKSGCFGYYRKIKLTDITDGPSNTIMIAETSTTTKNWWAAGDSSVRPFYPDKPITTNTGQFYHFEKNSSWLSKETALFPALFADGSVRTIYESRINTTQLQGLMTIQGGEKEYID